MPAHQFIVVVSSTDERDDAAQRIGTEVIRRLHNAFGDAVRVAHMTVEEVHHPEGAPDVEAR
jgi:ribosomal protein L35AE/L33A